jgi:hypothetical protein
MAGKFSDFKKAIQNQMQMMSKHRLFKVDIDKDRIWGIYLNSFPENTNPIYKERTEHDCNCCRQFIRDAGGLVIFKDGELISIWDVTVDAPYDSVAKVLADYVKTLSIKNVFLHHTASVGTDSNKQLLDDGSVTTWNHFYARLPSQIVVPGDTLGAVFSNFRSSKDVLKRGLEEISDASIETVLELIDQNSIYRGEEHKNLVEGFRLLKSVYDKTEDPGCKDNLCWCWAVHNETVARIRNSVIGTLLVDVEAGKDLDVAVKSFETKVAPTNYKRSSAIITKRMVEIAQAKVEELGLTDSLARRAAVVGDISINEILFANRTSSKIGENIFDEMKGAIKVNVKELKKVETVSVETFIQDIVPKASAIEVLLENRHVNNLVVLTAPVNQGAASLLKWGSGFAWAYNGDVADSIRERVKKAGGCVDDAVLRCSLSWFNKDDLDINVKEPGGNRINYQQKHNPITTGTLDVDMNVNDPVRDAVENIVWTDESEMQEGVYEVCVNNYTQREDADVGFVVEIDYKGTVYTFSYTKAVRQSEDVVVAKFNFSKDNGISFIESLPEKSRSKNIWGLGTQLYHNVTLLMNSPNHWGWHAIGNKHLFFILDNCHNPSPSRGFYNEFLREDLMPHRKVFEVLAAKSKVPASNNQLCGLGFSSTKKDHFYCKIFGTFSRVIKVNII